MADFKSPISLTVSQFASIVRADIAQWSDEAFQCVNPEGPPPSSSSTPPPSSSTPPPSSSSTAPPSSSSTTPPTSSTSPPSSTTTTPVPTTTIGVLTKSLNISRRQVHGYQDVTGSCTITRQPNGNCTLSNFIVNGGATESQLWSFIPGGPEYSSTLSYRYFIKIVESLEVVVFTEYSNNTGLINMSVADFNLLIKIVVSNSSPSSFVLNATNPPPTTSQPPITVTNPPAKTIPLTTTDSRIVNKNSSLLLTNSQAQFDMVTTVTKPSVDEFKLILPEVLDATKGDAIGYILTFYNSSDQVVETFDYDYNNQGTLPTFTLRITRTSPDNSFYQSVTRATFSFKAFDSGPFQIFPPNGRESILYNTAIDAGGYFVLQAINLAGPKTQQAPNLSIVTVPYSHRVYDFEYLTTIPSTGQTTPTVLDEVVGTAPGTSLIKDHIPTGGNPIVNAWISLDNLPVDQRTFRGNIEIYVRANEYFVDSTNTKHLKRTVTSIAYNLSIY